jgi:RNA polymerase sigma-70 factor (ECF subfamily)
MSFAEGDDARKTADAVARRSYGKLVAFLAARTRDVAAAEDALAEAFASALVDWPTNGCPKNPEGWLLTVARRKLIDSVRRRQTGEAASTQLQILAEGMEDAAAQAEKDMQIPDQRLALLFACAHPAIEAGIRAPLMLQVVLGLDGETIASAFLVSPAAMRKRLSRAKEKIQQAGIPFSIPEREELPHRLDTFSPRSTQGSRKAGPIRAARMRSVAISRRKPSFSRGSWSSCCRRKQKASGCLR